MSLLKADFGLDLQCPWPLDFHRRVSSVTASGPQWPQSGDQSFGWDIPWEPLGKKTCPPTGVSKLGKDTELQESCMGSTLLWKKLQ